MLRFRLPGREQVLGTWFAELFPELDRNARRRLLSEAVVRVGGREVDRAGMLCLAGAHVEVDAVPEDLARPLLRSLQARRDALFEAATVAADPEGSVAYRFWADEPTWFRGVLKGDLGSESDFEIRVEVEARQDGLAQLRLWGPGEFQRQGIAEALAEVGAAMVGDLLEGGLATRGPEATSDVEAPAAPWPEPGVTPRDETASPGFSLAVSDEAARAIGKGHAWLLPDAASESAARFRPGSLLRVSDRGGSALAWAYAEGDARLSARVWALGAGTFKEADSVEARVARALARRRPLWTGEFDSNESATEAFRLIHGEGDDLPGLFVDRMGPLLRVLVTGRACEGFKDRALGALQAQLPLTPKGEMWSILEVVHLHGAKNPTRRGRVERVRFLAGGPEAIADAGYAVEEGGFRVRERGLSLRVVPGWDDPYRTRPGYGLFVDQRENRARLDGFARSGGRWLNLFAHTGAFSASLLASGADEVVSVDLSAAYLEDLEANLEANSDRFKPGFRHVSVRRDGRRFLETRPEAERFDGIVLDPPTAAAAGRRFWNVRRDLEPMLKSCVQLLAPGGVLLVTQNQAGPPLGLERILERVATRAHRSLARIEQAPAGVDHPSRPGFPEGDPFEGVLIQVE